MVAGCISPLALTLSDLELDQLRTGLEGKVHNTDVVCGLVEGVGCF